MGRADDIETYDMGHDSGDFHIDLIIGAPCDLLRLFSLRVPTRVGPTGLPVLVQSAKVFTSGDHRAAAQRRANMEIDKGTDERRGESLAEGQPPPTRPRGDSRLASVRVRGWRFKALPLVPVRAVKALPPPQHYIVRSDGA